MNGPIYPVRGEYPDRSRKKLDSSETLLVGKWIYRDGLIREDDTSKRIEWLVDRELTEIAIDESGWNKLFKDPVDGRLWEQSFPESESQGGGPPLLACLTEEQARTRYKIVL